MHVLTHAFSTTPFSTLPIHSHVCKGSFSSPQHDTRGGSEALPTGGTSTRPPGHTSLHPPRHTLHCGWGGAAGVQVPEGLTNWRENGHWQTVPRPAMWGDCIVCDCVIPAHSIGVSNCWNGIWNGTVEWTMEWTIKTRKCQKQKWLESMQLTLLWLHTWVLTAKPFKLTRYVHQSICACIKACGSQKCITL